MERFSSAMSKEGEYGSQVRVVEKEYCVMLWRTTAEAYKQYKHTHHDLIFFLRDECCDDDTFLQLVVRQYSISRQYTKR